LVQYPQIIHNYDIFNTFDTSKSTKIHLTNFNFIQICKNNVYAKTRIFVYVLTCHFAWLIRIYLCQKRHAFSRNITPSQILFSFISQPSMQKALTCSLIPLRVLYLVIRVHAYSRNTAPSQILFILFFSCSCKKHWQVLLYPCMLLIRGHSFSRNTTPSQILFILFQSPLQKA
jgi:hypothetical protein